MKNLAITERVEELREEYLEQTVPYWEIDKMAEEEVTARVDLERDIMEDKDKGSFAFLYSEDQHIIVSFTFVGEVKEDGAIKVTDIDYL